MRSKADTSENRPLVIGRMTRILFGIISFVVIAVLEPSALGGVGTTLIAFLGVSFIVGGLIGNPGCEITTIPNLVLPKSKRVHCF